MKELVVDPGVNIGDNPGQENDILVTVPDPGEYECFYVSPSNSYKVCIAQMCLVI
jgi:hypothetical protein